MLVNIHRLKFLLSILIAMVFSATSTAQVWTLQGCIDTALVNNRNLEIGRNSMLIGEQRHKEAIANLIPKVNAIADYKYYTIGLYLEKPGSIAYIYTSNSNLYGYHVSLSPAASDLNYEDVFTVNQTQTFDKTVFPYQFQITAYVGKFDVH